MMPLPKKFKMKKLLMLTMACLSFSAGNVLGRSHSIDDFIQTILKKGATISELNQFERTLEGRELDAQKKVAAKNLTAEQVYQNMLLLPQDTPSEYLKMLQATLGNSTKYEIITVDEIKRYQVRIGTKTLWINHFIKGPTHDLSGAFDIEYIDNTPTSKALDLTD